MNVPNHEKKAFRDLTPEERSAIVEALLCDEVEIFVGSGWIDKKEKALSFASTYRTRPRQLVIPWEHIKPEYKWAAMDGDGCVFFYQDKPEIGAVGFGSADYAFASALNIDTAGIDWRESLTQRPK